MAEEIKYRKEKSFENVVVQLFPHVRKKFWLLG
jgi:hypothetical protein